MTCPEQVCPGDLVCQAGFCVKPGSRVQCGGAGAGSSAEGGTAGGRANPGQTAGAAQGGSSGGPSGNPHGSSGPSGKGGSASTSNSDAGGVAGEAGAGLGGASALAITVQTQQSCTGAPAEAKLKVSGGTPPYAWNIKTGPHGLHLDANGEEATVSKTFADAEDYQVTVTVTDANGASRDKHFALAVHATPVITVAALPPVCPDEVYALPLTAEGGDPSSYEWSTDLSKDTGLDIVAGVLGGPFKNSARADADVAVTLNLTSDGCTAAPVELTLTEKISSDVDCPAVRVVDKRVLPAACANQPYTAALTLAKPAASTDYTWNVVHLPAGLALDSNQVLSGTPNASGLVQVEAVGGGRTFRGEFELAMRDKCWLAYLAPENGVSRLGIFDPVLRQGHTTPSDPAAAPVLDFKFSSDGRFLAYRTAASSGAGALTVVDMTSMAEHALGYDQVTDYAWAPAPHASTLAIASGTADTRALGGITLDATSTALDHFFTLPAIGAKVDSPLVWSAGTEIAFLSAGTSARPGWPLTTILLGDAGFGIPVQPTDWDFSPGSELRPAADGLFGIPSDGTPIAYYAVNSSLDTPHDNVFISGTGRAVATAQGGLLDIFLPTTTTALPPDELAPDAYAPGCDGVLAWAPARERIACLASLAEAHAQVNVFDFEPESATLSPAVLVKGVDVPDVVPSHRQRLFSPSGARLALTQADSLIVANVATGAAALQFEHDFAAAPGADDTVLSFAPSNESLLLEQRGGELALFDLDESDGAYTFLTGELANPVPCTDDPRAAADAFCGGERPHVAFTWSPAGAELAYVTASGELVAVGFPLLPDTSKDVASVTHACSGCTAGREFVFQP